MYFERFKESLSYNSLVNGSSLIISSLTVVEDCSVESLTKDMLGNRYSELESNLNFQNSNSLHNLSIFVHEYRHLCDCLQNYHILGYFLELYKYWNSMRNFILELSTEYGKQPIQLINDKILISSALQDNKYKHLLHSKGLLNSISKPAKWHLIRDVADTFPVNKLAFISENRPYIVIGDYVTEINYLSIMEGSAVLSQITFLLSTFGPTVVQAFWKNIQEIAIETCQFQYINALKYAQLMLGENCIFNGPSIFLIRSSFRNAIMSSAINRRYQKEYNAAEMNDNPSIRLYTYLRQASEYLRKKSFKKPKQVQKLIKKVNKTKFEDTAKTAIRYKYLLSDIKLELEHQPPSIENFILESIIILHAIALEKDFHQTDQNIDFIMADDHDNAIPYPIRIIKGIDESSYRVMFNHVADLEKSFESLYIYNSFLDQIVSSNSILCPASMFPNYCKCNLAFSDFMPIQECTVKQCYGNMVFNYICGDTSALFGMLINLAIEKTARINFDD